jgi:hypothetical protein
MFKKSNTNISRRPAFIMKAVIICDDFAFRAHAASALARVGNHAGINVRWTTKCWPINALNESALAEKVLVEALDAQLILFPESRAWPLSPTVFDWLNRWAARRTVQDAGLGVIKDGNEAQLTTSLVPELSSFVRQHGLSFIVDGGPPVRNPMRVFVRFQNEHQVALPVAQAYLVGIATGGSYRGFGIND